MPTNFDQSFYGGVWYNKRDQVVFGVVEADSPQAAVNKFTGNGFRTGLKSGPVEIRMLGVSNSPILQARVRNKRIIATTYNRWLRRTNKTGTVIQSQPWTKPLPQIGYSVYQREINTLEAEVRALKRANEILNIPGPLVPEYKLKAAHEQIADRDNTIDHLRKDLEHAKDQIDLLAADNDQLHDVISRTADLLKEV